MRQAGLIHRGERRKVLVRGRMRAGGAPLDVCVRDVSARGMLVQAGTPPLRGAFVEISGAGLTIIGQVVWAKDRRFGVRTQDLLRPDSFAREFDDPRMVTATTPVREGKRRWSRPNTAHAGERSRWLGRAVQFGVLITGVAGAAGGLAFIMHDTLSGVARSVSERL